MKISIEIQKSKVCILLIKNLIFFIRKVIHNSHILDKKQSVV